jgi:hypothetical protein
MIFQVIIEMIFEIRRSFQALLNKNNQIKIMNSLFLALITIFWRSPFHKNLFYKEKLLPRRAKFLPVKQTNQSILYFII